VLGETPLTAQREPRSACSTRQPSNLRSRSHPRLGAGARGEGPPRAERRQVLVPRLFGAAHVRRITGRPRVDLL